MNKYTKWGWGLLLGTLLAAMLLVVGLIVYASIKHPVVGFINLGWTAFLLLVIWLFHKGERSDSRG